MLYLNQKYQKPFLIVVILCFIFLISFFNYQDLDKKVSTVKLNLEQQLQFNYEIWTSNKSDEADLIYEKTINKSEVLEILTKAFHSTSEQERDLLRNRLYKRLYKDYAIYNSHGLLQYHFVFPNNIVFLRLHKHEKYGDDLTDSRKDFVKTNKEHVIVRGFSEGKTAHAIRNVYPIFNQVGDYVASIEISYPTELFQNKLNQISHIHTHFLIKKSVFDSKAWSREDRIQNYTPSYESDDYLMSNYYSHDQKEESIIKQHISNHHEEIAVNIDKDKPFSIYSTNNQNSKIISFYPVLQNVTGDLVAWLVSYNDGNSIKMIYHDFYQLVIIKISFLVAILLLFYILIKQKKKLKNLLSSYDDNVIFSKTDLAGKITYASKAFCRISGYTYEELFGKNHNIIRHPDMPQQTFKEMWQTLKSGKVWRGEVKNLRKNGTFYWVDAELEPERNEQGTVIGYIAIRHDITAIKEIERVQKEIIYAIGAIGESHSKETCNHVKRVSLLSKVLGEEYGLHKEELNLIEQASPMHDIGKIAIPDAILQKPAKLTAEEWMIMKTHTQKGYDMLSHSSWDLLAAAAIIAYEHHEKWDGTGYPRGLKGEEIHIYGRITALVDVYDALSSDRVYKKAWKEADVLIYIREQREKHFDPLLVDIFLQNYHKFKKIREEYIDVF